VEGVVGIMRNTAKNEAEVSCEILVSRDLEVIGSNLGRVFGNHER
jgi:hypothetical protein